MPGPTVGAGEGRSREAEWVDEVRRHEASGDYFIAFDTARHGLEHHPESRDLKYRAVLALARAGATTQARRYYDEYALGDSDDTEVIALDARLHKDEGLALSGAEGRDLLRRSIEIYEELHRRTGAPFPAINVATLSLVVGDATRAARHAAELACGLQTPHVAGRDEDAFWTLATLIEAKLIVGATEAAQALIEPALEASGRDFSLIATAMRSLLLTTRAKGVDAAWLERLRPPRVIHYCGHIVAPPGQAGRFTADQEARVAGEIERLLAAGDVGFGFGSLAAGADILFAEAILGRGGQLSVVLPFNDEEFVERSVRPSGAGWVDRFWRCREAADEQLRYSTGADERFLDDDPIYGYSSRQAMGLAVLRAEHLFAAVEQIAVWDGAASVAGAGTAHDVAVWRGTGRPQRIIAVPGAPADSATAPASAPAGKRTRHARAMLFGDLQGFSKLSDEQMTRFVPSVLGRVAAVLKPYDAHLLSRNTWGDGLFLVFDEASLAADCALDLQEAMAAFDFAAHGLPASLALRIGGHFGPVFEYRDPVLDRPNYFGAQVSRAARIEPITPAGCVYVTEPFASALALEHSDRFGCDYVGNTAAAKDYGKMRMFLLRRRRAGWAEGAGAGRD